MAEIIKNTTSNPVFIKCMGVTIPASGEWSVPAVLFGDAADSMCLDSLLEDGTLVLNDGTSDLSYADAKKFLVGDEAGGIKFSPGDSGLSSNNVDEAIKELKALIDAL